jgi:hypothetical protein
MKGEDKMTNYCVVRDKKLIGFIVNSDDLEYAKKVATNFKGSNLELVEIELVENFPKMFRTCFVGVDDATLTNLSKIKLFDLGISKNNEPEQEEELSCYDPKDYVHRNPYDDGRWW